MRDGIDRRQFLKAGAVLGGGILGGGIFDLVDAMGSGRQDAACGCFDNSLPPVLRIRSGDTVVIETGAHRLDGMVLGAETEDWIGRYKDAMARRPDTRFYPDPAAGVEEQGKHPGHAHLAGPIHVEGAEPGDILRIEILEIIPALYGFHIKPGPSTVKGRVQWYRTNLERFEFGFRDEVRIPLRPFAGTLGVQHPESGRYADIPPGKHAGNLDMDRIAGTVLHVPVRVKGAGVLAGDSHRAQRDGEAAVGVPEGAFRNLTLRMTVRRDLTHSESCRDSHQRPCRLRREQHPEHPFRQP